MDEEVRKAIESINGHLGDLQGETHANTHDLKNLRGDFADLRQDFKAILILLTTVIERVDGMVDRLDLMTARTENIDRHLTEVRGSFASIETYLVRGLESDNSTSKRLEAVEARLDALEKKKAS